MCDVAFDALAVLIARGPVLSFSEFVSFLPGCSSSLA
jgi:hypothetical protein